MAASEAMIGYGGKVYVETADSPGNSPHTYIELAEIFNMTPPNQQADEVDVTHNQSPNRTRERIAGLIDPGEAGFEMNWVPGSASDIILINLKTSGTRVSWKFEFPNGTYWEFAGFVKGYEVSAQTEDKMTANVAITTAGAVDPSYA